MFFYFSSQVVVQDSHGQTFAAVLLLSFFFLNMEYGSLYTTFKNHKHVSFHNWAFMDVFLQSQLLHDLLLLLVSRTESVSAVQRALTDEL